MKGDLIIFSEALLWSLFPVITIMTYKGISPLYAASITTFFAAVFFAIVLSFQHRWHEITIKAAWKDIFLAILYNGVILYALVFIGLKYTSAGNASLIGLLEVFFSFIVLGLLKKEKVTWARVGGAILMFSGALFVVAPKSAGINLGDFIILGAQFFAPLGNLAQQDARKKVSSSTIMFLRSLVSSAILLCIALLSDPVPASIEAGTAMLLIISGIMFMGFSKLLWIEGIHRIPITRANSINIITPFLTLGFAFLLLKDIPHWGQLMGIIPLTAGAIVLLRKDKKIMTA